jgi:predicted enzyme related to lactoylglutathione lyase
MAAFTTGAAEPSGAQGEHGGFTGEVKIVLYVRDVRQAVAFYSQALGFTFHHFYDVVSGGSVREWPRDKPPNYAELSYAGRRFGLHAPTSEADERSVGAARIHFRVRDLEAHHRRTAAYGAKPSEIKKRSWMDMFHVVDPNGNRVFFAFTDAATHGNPWYGQ